MFKVNNKITRLSGQPIYLAERQLTTGRIGSSNCFALTELMIRTKSHKTLRVVFGTLQNVYEGVFPKIANA